MRNIITTITSMLARATVVTVDGGPHLHAWESCELNGEDNNEIFRFSWEEDGYTFASILTEGGVKAGSFDESGAFTCNDNNGELTTINFFTLAVILPTEEVITSPPLSEFIVKVQNGANAAARIR